MSHTYSVQCDVGDTIFTRDLTSLKCHTLTQCTDAMGVSGYSRGSLLGGLLKNGPFLFLSVDCRIITQCTVM